MRATLQTIISIMIMTLIFPACRKKGNSTPGTTGTQKFTGCRITQISQNGGIYGTGITYKFRYNNDGSVSTISFSGGGDSFVKTISNKRSCIIVYGTDNGSPSTKDSLLLDAQNRVIYIDHYEYNGDPQPNEVYDQYFYDSLGNLVSITFHNYTTVSSQVFQWANGDLQWNTSGTDFYTYVYDTGLYNSGNITARITDFVNYGIGIYAARHLHSKAIMNNSDTVNYTYTLDAAGKLTSLNEVDPGGYVSTSAITYDCE